MRYVIRGCLGLILLLMSACDIPSMSSVLATAGQENITRQDVVYRIGIAKGYGNREPMNELALIYEINDALTRQVAAKLGVVVSKEDVDKLNETLEKPNKDTKILNAVKWVFGDDHAGYRRVFLAPRVLNRKLLDWYEQHVAKQPLSPADVKQAIAQSAAGQGKTPFDIWLRQQAQQLQVHIKDKTLKAGIQKKYPHTWWLNT